MSEILVGYVIDKQGLVIKVIETFEGKRNELENGEVIVVQPSQSFYEKRWDGVEWVEGATQEEIDEMTKVEPSPPTQAEILEQRLADLELMLAEILFN